MNLLKNNFRLIVFIIILILVSSGISVFATYNYLASDIKYTDDKSVADALNDLYSIHNNNNNNETIEKTLLWTNEKTNQSISQLDIELNNSLENFSHILVQWYLSTTDNTMYEDIYSLKPYRSDNSFYAFTGKTSDGSFTRRMHYVNNTTLRILQTFRLNGAVTKNNLIIPYRIYGLNLE